LLPAGVTYVSDVPSQGTYTSGTGLWVVGSLANAASETLDITATVDLGTSGSLITNTASVTASDQADPNAANYSDSADINVQETADLSVAKIVDDVSPSEGGTIVYTVTVSNGGPDAATGIEVTDLLPAGVTYVSDVPSQGTYTSGTGLWVVGSLANAASATLDITATVDLGTSGSLITNTASVTASDQADANAANDSDSADITVEGIADLAVTKLVDDPAPSEGGTVVYTVTVTNGGPNGATGVEVTDLLPAGVTYVSDVPSQGTYTSGTGLWVVGSLANAASATLDITATVDLGTGSSTITNTASVTASDQADPNAANDSDSADITVTTLVSAGPIALVPTSFALSTGRPNPFHESTTIEFDLPVAETVSLVVFDTTGRLVRSLVSGTMAPGRFVITWDGRNESNQRVSAGLYLVRLQAGSFAATQKSIRLE
ncbi:MAG: FlgD immunoglobulin-like domain containing protein, partial [Candidatus Eiseniibacteriota bacterium]